MLRRARRRRQSSVDGRRRRIEELEEPMTREEDRGLQSRLRGCQSFASRDVEEDLTGVSLSGRRQVTHTRETAPVR
eukprot:374413-Hanusia_phi.AAC.2